MNDAVDSFTPNPKDGRPNFAEKALAPDRPNLKIDNKTFTFRSIQAAGTLAVLIHGCSSADEISCKPPGTMVRRGDALALEWPMSAAVPLAPVDGRIVGLGSASLSANVSMPAILIEANSIAQTFERQPAASPVQIVDMLRRLHEMDLATGIEQLRKHGVSIDRWTTPDLLGQLRICLRKPVDTILCDVLDESPDLLLHDRIAAAYPVEVAAGILALAALTRAQKVCAVLAAFGNSASWQALSTASANTALKLVALRDHYPQSHPSLLIHELTGRHSRPVRSPAESGVLVIGAPAAVAIGRCFLNNESMLDLPVAIHDQRQAHTYWLNVPLGTPWSAVLAHLSIGGSRLDLRAGNPLREMKLTPECVIAGGDLTATLSFPERFTNPDPCIRCAWCVEGCPVQIQPAGLLEAAQQDDPYLADRFGLDACVECGICNYVCPSHLPILAGIRKLRLQQVRGR